MKIKFKDLFYMDDDEDKEDAKCEIDVRDVKLIMANQDGTFLIENMDGVFYKTDFIKFNEEVESKLFVKANNAKPCPMCGSQDIYIEEFDRDAYKAVHIQCIKCGLHGFKDFTQTEKNPIKKTIEYWNTRS